jgi:CBS domain-containing membrane protein
MAAEPTPHEATAPELVRTRMRESFISAAPEDVLWHVAQLMQLARIRHLPVMDGARLVGVVSHRDVLGVSGPAGGGTARGRHERLHGTPVASVMCAPVHTVGPEDTLSTAAERMLRFKIGCLPVLERDASGEERVVGLITESDLLAAAYLPRIDARTLERLHERRPT